MRIYKNIGSKERLFEMMERVNKIKVNEYIGNNLNSKSILEFSFNNLISKKLNVKQSNVQTNDDNTYVELLCLDNNGNNITFIFKSNATEGDQDGVYNVNNVILTNFTFDDISTGESIELNENDLNEFNTKYGNQLFDVVDDYLDYESPEPEIDEEYENAIKKIDSYKLNNNEEKSIINNLPEDKKKIIKTAHYNLTRKKGKPEYAPSTSEISAEILRMRQNNEINEILTLKKSDDFPITSANKILSTLAPQQKNYIINIAINNINDKLKKLNVNKNELTQEEFFKMIKDEARRLFIDYSISGNEVGGYGSGLNENDEYPDPIGKKFKAKTKYPKPKKKPTSTVSIDEDDECSSKNDENEPEKNFTEPEIEKLENDKEEIGDILNGGLGDNKTPNEFDTEQILMGVKVELEHTDDPLLAMEIAIDHLTEIPDYYTRLNKMEADAEAEMENGLESEKSEDEMEDILLGYDPKNVGDNIEDNKEEK